MTRDISERLDASSGALIDGPDGRDRASPPQTVAGKIDAMSVVDQAIEDRIGVGRIADQRMPLVDRDLTGDDGRAAAIAFFEDLEEVVAGAGFERLETPIVEDQQLGASKAAQ